MKIAVLTAMHHRPKVTELFLKAIKNLSIHIDVVSVVSNGDTESMALCKQYGVHAIYHENKPLGAKRNAGIGLALRLKPDYVVDCGDDDLLTEDWLQTVLPYMEAKLPFGGLDSAYVVMYGSEYAAAKIKYGEKKMLGCGAFIRADVLEMASKFVKVNWIRGVHNEFRDKKVLRYSLAQHFSDTMRCRIVSEPFYQLWENSANSSMDYVRDFRIAEIGYTPLVIHTETPTMIDVKSSQNIWSFEDVLKSNWAKQCSFDEVKPLLEKAIR